ncbi:MAG: homocysteine S-methyltransferase family protein [Candidatus Aceula meridiana]|nr:homocysteine S-methyltransferase family protein [Candidatus Aceula meridiana]
MAKIKNLLKKRIVVLDGATGTELQMRGMPKGACPEKWCLKNPKLLSQVHRDYLAAGSDIVYTCTFGANRYKLAEYGVKDIRGTNRRLAQIAKKAVGNKALVAGDIGPTGKFIEPFGPLAFDEAVNAFKEQVKGLIDGGVDLFVIETMIDVQEARAALIAVKELTAKFTMVTMTFEQDGRTLNGTDPLTALITLQSLGADAVGCNCSAGPKEMLKFIASLTPYAKVPLVAKPNAGIPKLVDGKTIFDMPPKVFASYAKRFAKLGVCFIGGCCGTTPEHIVNLKQNLKGAKPAKSKRSAISALSSARDNIVLEKRKNIALVGECINPTGRKALQAELCQGKTTIIRQLAKEQERRGADILDVNVGAPGIDEVTMMKNTVNLLSVATSLPLVIDSPNIKAVETALRVYPGRALINSISAEKEKIEKLLPVAAKYGAMFILLPLGFKGIPKTFQERKKNVEYVWAKAKKLGIQKEDIIIDGLVMAISSLKKAAIETIKTVAWSMKTFKCNTIAGLSNVSFGLPQRSVLNSTFLEILKKNGLSLVIANPIRITKGYSKKAADVLLNRDKDAARYIAHFSKQPKQELKSELRDLSAKEKVCKAILEGNREDIVSFVKELLSIGVSAKDIVYKSMIPSINKVGDFFDQKKYFLPQLIASAEAMKAAFHFLEPRLQEKGGEKIKKTVVILATVKGDIHDIGKNIVALMLKNHGFDVVDLGHDVDPKKIISEIKRHKSPIVGLSALMTTTMVSMKDVINEAKRQKLSCRFMAGGAVITPDYAKSIGAKYSADGVSAVKVAKCLS